MPTNATAGLQTSGAPPQPFTTSLSRDGDSRGGGIGPYLNVAVRFCHLFIVTVQAPVPVQAPLQPAKL
jgi:hypothetical protein